ncbi:c-type cytochrome [Bradyrhizobium sp. CCBAU 51627]|uniref:c-type cytochrome n=1 Tax=Bradyrhizobium sp. CCBAU 51627 TaxID=1325088 RepID=UPI002304E7E5|nr:c-type cytochrome [Bradyrhizobium sp. CCBAU 51627]MDA9436238.1 cytochrome C [Bradyrhizobium sp. CCBAU 51627]
MDRLLFVALVAFFVSSPAGAQQDRVARGKRDFRVCAACHSLEPDRNMTGPSLANVWGRNAGGLPSFDRYSDALKASGIIWDDRSLDAWLTDPARMVPDNEMPFEGIKDSRARADLLAFLKEATTPGAAPERTAENRMNGMGGMMGGMMSGGRAPNLKDLDPSQHVTGISHCRDTYRVTTADGKTRHFWERNLRLKTDSSQDGPQGGAPALLPAGMMGDRADVIFAAPEEISKSIAPQC